MKLTIYCVQHDIAWEDKPSNFQRIETMLAAAPLAPGGLIVLPEMFATGFSRDLSKTAEPVDGETARFLRNLAMRTQCAVMGGLISWDSRSDAAFGHNESVCYGPQGTLLARYRKRQPFALAGESDVHTAGTESVVFEYGGFQIAPQVCYDLRFPEIARQAVAQGAQVLINIASWPARRVQHWVTLLQARAIENQAYVIGVNRTGTDPEFTYPGRSIVVDPHGSIIADTADNEQVLTTTLDAQVLYDWRTQFPALRDAGFAYEA